MIQRVNPQVDFVEIEHSVLDFWEKKDIFQKRRDANSGNPKSVSYTHLTLPTSDLV